MVVIVLLGVFFIFAMALLFHSSGERKSVKQLVSHQTAEMVALSGIDWAEAQLLKGRWYGKPFTRGVHKGRKTYGIKTIAMPNGGEVTVVCQDVPRRKPLWDIDLLINRGREDEVNIGNIGMQELWLLHHIDVYSLGTYNGKKCLIYGRFAMSPEPALNDNSTDGLKYKMPGLNPFDNIISVPEQTESGRMASEYKVTKLSARNNQSVNMNSIIAVLTESNSGETVEVRPYGVGRVKDIALRQGETCRPGDLICKIEKNSSRANGIPLKTKTLKKMVRITKVPLGLFPDFDITELADRGSVSNYINQISDAFLINSVAHASLEKKVANMSISSLPEKIDANKLFRAFPTDVINMTRERAQNMFIKQYISNFTPPGCKWENKEKVKKYAYLQLAHSNVPPKASVYRELQEIGRLDALDTVPRKNSAYFTPRIAGDQYIKLLLGGNNYNIPTSSFMRKLSGLDDAARNINVKLDSSGAPLPASTGNPQITKIRKKYTYVDPVDKFTVEMEDLIAFAEKYYSSADSEFPKEETRTVDHTDWPLPTMPPPPPVGPNQTLVRIPGKRGMPPGPPRWTPSTVSTRKVPFPSGGHRSFEPSNGSPNRGVTRYRVPGLPPKEGVGATYNPPVDGDLPSNIFSAGHKPIVLAKNTGYRAAPGAPGRMPVDGDWKVEDKYQGGGDGEDKGRPNPVGVIKNREVANIDKGGGGGGAPGPKKTKNKEIAIDNHGGGNGAFNGPGSAAPVPKGKIKDAVADGLRKSPNVVTQGKPNNIDDNTGDAQGRKPNIGNMTNGGGDPKKINDNTGWANGRAPDKTGNLNNNGTPGGAGGTNLGGRVPAVARGNGNNGDGLGNGGAGGNGNDLSDRDPRAGATNRNGNVASDGTPDSPGYSDNPSAGNNTDENGIPIRKRYPSNGNSVAEAAASGGGGGGNGGGGSDSCGV